MVFLIILALILLNGVFSMAEIALISSKKYRLENANKKESKSAKTALELRENPSRFLSTVQIGITLIGILLGIYSGDHLTDDLEIWLSGIPFLKNYASSLAVGMIVISITYVSIVLGELFPKQLGLSYPEKISILLSPFMKVVSILTSPFVWLLSTSNDALSKLFRVHAPKRNRISEEEIKSIIREGTNTGEVQDIEQQIIEKVFQLGDQKIGALVTHRNHLVTFETKESWQTIREKVEHQKHSAYPVCKNGNVDEILGVVLLKDLFPVMREEGTTDLSPLLKQPLYLNENTFVYDALALFKLEKMHYGIVVDEYGITQGILTMDDMLDALVGGATEIDYDATHITVRDEHSWFVDGQYPFRDFADYFQIDPSLVAPDEFNTVAGYIIQYHRTIPKIGTKIPIDSYTLEILDMDGQRIDKLLVRKNHTTNTISKK